jgi:hypothetical protein
MNLKLYCQRKYIECFSPYNIFKLLIKNVVYSR